MPRLKCCRGSRTMPIQQGGSLDCCDRLHAGDMAQHCPKLAADFRGHHLAVMRPMRQHCKGAWSRAVLTHSFGAEQEAPIYIFVAIVPVTMDAYFKLWIFRGLNRKNPAAAVTLKSMDRH